MVEPLAAAQMQCPLAYISLQEREYSDEVVDFGGLWFHLRYRHRIGGPRHLIGMGPRTGTGAWPSTRLVTFHLLAEGGEMQLP